MKATLQFSNKDTVASATLVAISLFAIATGLFNSNPVVAKTTAPAVQVMEGIVVTAPRGADTTLEAMIVTASRLDHRA